jgi:hypothetical protein
MHRFHGRHILRRYHDPNISRKKVRRETLEHKREGEEVCIVGSSAGRMKCLSELVEVTVVMNTIIYTRTRIYNERIF